MLNNNEVTYEHMYGPHGDRLAFNKAVEDYGQSVVAIVPGQQRATGREKVEPEWEPRDCLIHDECYCASCGDENEE